VATEGVVLRCRCGLPWARIENGCLVVVSRHHGERHVNQIALPDLLAAMCGPGQLARILPILYEAEGYEVSTPGRSASE